MRKTLLALALFAGRAASAEPAHLSNEVRNFVSVDAPMIALTHVRIIDGTGGASREDQTIVIAGSVIRAIGLSATLKPPAGALVLDKQGETALPGLVGMHDHLFYATFDDNDLMHEIPVSATRLYLASGVTTIRTAGSVNPSLDLAIKRRIDDGRMAGPKIHVTGPYLDGKAGMGGPQMLALTTKAQVVRTVNFWADEGVTSFKIYMDLPRDLAAVAVETAHKRGIKVTGHLGAFTFHDAIALGIDNIEHGLCTVTDFDSGKTTAQCPDDTNGHMASLATLDLEAPKVKALIAELVQHHVALTSTLAVYESKQPGDAGFEPREAIHIATQNGASFLGEDAHTGTLAVGKHADLFLVRGNPAANIKDIEKVDVVFKDGVGYDSEKLIQSVRGAVGYR
jgi:imidazolonepropionase-like amidohydrolase